MKLRAHNRSLITADLAADLFHPKLLFSATTTGVLDRLRCKARTVTLYYGADLKLRGSLIGTVISLNCRGVTSSAKMTALHTTNAGANARATAAANIVRRAWSHTSILTFLLVCSVFLNVLLAQRVSRIEGTLLDMRLKLAEPLAVGSSVPPIAARDLDGSPVLISYTGSEPPTVLYIFTPDCVWCMRNLENVRTLADSVRNEYRFIGLSLNDDKLRDYVAQHSLDFPIYSDLRGTVRMAYRLSATPHTIVISAEGRILRSWEGAYAGDLQREVEEYFHVRLPGITEL